MKINFHPRGTSKTIIDKDLEAVDYFCISTVAYAAIPSCRPVKPNFSVVVALMEISSTSTWRTSAITRFISGICGFSFGRRRRQSHLYYPMYIRHHEAIPLYRTTESCCRCPYIHLPYRGNDNRYHAYCCAQQGITNSMNQDIRITMPLQAHRMLYFHSAQPQITLRNQCMHIISKPNPYFHHFNF